MASPVTAAAGARDAAVRHAATRVGALFAGIQDTLAGWRAVVLAGTAASTTETTSATTPPATTPPSVLDALVGALVLPALAEADPLLIGAGFIAAPELTGGDRLHFSWWLGPLDDNPVTGATAGPTRLDLGARSYVDYLGDLRALEWYQVPQSTHRTHIAGPYVDHLCACDYIVTVTAPVERDGRMAGVVGVDVTAERLERALLPALLAVGHPLALANGEGRVLLSTDPAVAVGTAIAVPGDAARCAGTPFRLVPTAAAASAPRASD